MASETLPEPAYIHSISDTVGDPTLIEADELLERFSGQEGKQTERLEKSLAVKMIDNSLGRIEGKIKTEEEKTSPDHTKLGRLRESQAKLEKKRVEIMARPDERADKKEERLESKVSKHAEDLGGSVKRMEELGKEKVALEGEIAAIKATTLTPETTLELSQKETALGKVEAELAKLEKGGSLETQKDRHERSLAMSKKIKEVEEAEHKKEVAIVEKELDDFLEGKTDEASEKTDKDEADPAKTDEGAGERKNGAGEQEKGSWSDRMAFIAGGLAKGLANDPPNPDNPIEKLVYKAKGMGLQLAMAFGGGTEWARTLEQPEKDILLKTLGMKVEENPAGELVDVEGEDGTTTKEKPLVIKWEKPDEKFRAPEAGMAIVLKDIYGTNWLDTALQTMDPKTTVESFTKTVKEMDDGKEKTQNEVLLARMTAAGATEEDAVLKFVEENWDELKNKPETAEPVA